MNQNSLPSTSLVDLQITGSEAKRIFDSNYLLMLAQRHPGLDKKYLINFLHRAQLTGADPRIEQIYLVERNNKIKGKNGQQDQWEKVGIVVFSYGFVLGVVQEHKDYGGIQSRVETRKRYLPKMKRGQYGDLELDLEGGVTEREELCAVATVYRDEMPYEYVAWISDYYQAKNPKWASSPDTMLRKCAEVAACRHAFADKVQGFYGREEVESAFGDQVAVEVQGEVIEAEKTQKAVESAVSLEELKSRDHEKRRELHRKVAEITNFFTKGMAMQQKSEWVTKNLGVMRFEDVGKVDEDFLKGKVAALEKQLEQLNDPLNQQEVYKRLSSADKARGV